MKYWKTITPNTRFLTDKNRVQNISIGFKNIYPG